MCDLCGDRQRFELRKNVKNMIRLRSVLARSNHRIFMGACSRPFSSSRDLYEILRVEENASTKQIKRSFRELAMKLHPDRSQLSKEEAQDRFVEISEAYQILTDPNERRMYDEDRRRKTYMRLLRAMWLILVRPTKRLTVISLISKSKTVKHDGSKSTTTHTPATPSSSSMTQAQ